MKLILPDYLKPLELLTIPFPQAAVEKAIARREESIPHLLAALESVTDSLADGEEIDPDYMLPIYALNLLAQFRETRALSLALRLFSHPEHERITGDLSVDSLHRIFASICGDNILPLLALIENPGADEFVRGAAVLSLAVLVEEGAQPREEISRYYGSLFLDRLERDTESPWESLIVACVELRMVEHLGAIRACYDEMLIDDYYWEQEDLELQIAKPPGADRNEAERFDFIDDTIAELSDWACFDLEEAARDAAFLAANPGFYDREEDLAAPVYDLPEEPYVREAPKVGRNDLCPCGSGKKYKKCCGQTA